jgi:hypothetical protein
MEQYLNAPYVHRDIRSLRLPPASEPFPCPVAASGPARLPLAPALAVAAGAVLLGVFLGLAVLLLLTGWR